MKVELRRGRADDIEIYENVSSVKAVCDARLGAGIRIKIKGKRNSIRISMFDLTYFDVIE